MNAKIEICKSFNQHAHEYEQVAKVQHEIGRRMFERLDYLKINPARILDLGCGTGQFTSQLKRRYPKAEIVGFDIAYHMLLQAREKQGWRRKWPLINGDMTYMPFASGVFDLVFSNQVIHWSNPVKDVFRELNRVMKVNGCLMFTTLGPDTFKELRQAWSMDHHAHANEFADMHDIGDWLLNEHFLEPVIDMELLTVQYDTLAKLLQALKMQGVRNINQKRKQGLTGKKLWQQFVKNYAEQTTSEGKYPLSYEVVYGHAWKEESRRTQHNGETLIPVSAIKRRTFQSVE